MEWLRDHAPLVILTVVAVLATMAAGITGHAFAISLAANVWGVVILLVAFDITPKDTQEKRESV